MTRGVKINQFICGIPGEGTHFLENLLNNSVDQGLKNQKTNEYHSVVNQKNTQKLNSDRILAMWLKEHFKKTNELLSIDQLPQQIKAQVDDCVEQELGNTDEIQTVIAHSLPFYTVHQKKIHSIRTLWHIEPSPQTVWVSHVLAWIKNQWSPINEHTLLTLINHSRQYPTTPDMAFPQLQKTQSILSELGDLHDDQCYMVYDCTLAHAVQGCEITVETVKQYLDREFWRGHSLKYRGTQLIRDYFKKYPELLTAVHSCTHGVHTLDYAQWCLDLRPSPEWQLTPEQQQKTREYTEKNLDLIERFSAYTSTTTGAWIQQHVEEFRERLSRN